MADPTNIHDEFDKEFERQMNWEMHKMLLQKRAQEKAPPKNLNNQVFAPNYIMTQENNPVDDLVSENVEDDDASLVKNRHLLNREFLPAKLKRDIESNYDHIGSPDDFNWKSTDQVQFSYIPTSGSYFQKEQQSTSTCSPQVISFPDLSPAVEYFLGRAQSLPRFSRVSVAHFSPTSRMMGEAQREYLALKQKLKLLEQENQNNKEVIVNANNGMNELGSQILKLKLKYEERFNARKSKIRGEGAETDEEEEKVTKLLFTDNLWKVVITIMTGIKMSVKAFDFQKKIYTPLEKDYVMMNRFEIHHPALENYKQASFKDYAPTIFNYLRKTFGIFPEAYIQSLGPESLANVITGSAGSYEGQNSAGQSGSFFFTSMDKRFLVKTIKKDEFELLMKVLPEYCDYLINNKKTLLNRIYGLHRIIMKTPLGISDKFTIIVMDNLFKSNVPLKKIFDLKGSTYGRRTK